MDFWQTVMVLVRRWYVAVPTFVGGLVLAAVAYAFVPATYESGSVLALTSPLAGSTRVSPNHRPGALTNPLLNFDPSLSQTAALLIQETKSPAVASSLGVHPGGGTEYVVNNGSSNPELLQAGPFVFITGRASSAAAAEEITGQVADKVAEILDLRQEELLAPASTHIDVQTVVAVTTGERLTGKPARVAVVSLVVAALVSLAAVFGLESFATRVRRPRAPAPQPREPRRAGVSARPPRRPVPEAAQRR